MPATTTIWVVTDYISGRRVKNRRGVQMGPYTSWAGAMTAACNWAMRTDRCAVVSYKKVRAK